MEGEYLPDNLSTLSIGAIHNRTFMGELDLRLKHELRRKLLRNPNFRLMPKGRGELTLAISLTKAEFVRSLDTSDIDISSLRVRLAGTVVLRRTDSKPRLMRERTISVTSLIRFDQPVIETPAVRDEVINDAIVAFVERVESLIYMNF